MRKSVIGGAIALALVAACAPTGNLSADNAKFAAEVQAFNADFATKAQAFSTGAITDAKTVGKSACGLVSELDGLYNAVKPVALIAGAASTIGTPEAAAIETAAMVSSNLACAVLDKADPTTPVATIESAAAQVLTAVPQVKAALKAASPEAAAAVEAPAKTANN